MADIFMNGLVYIDGKFQNIDFAVENGKFVKFGKFNEGIDLKGFKVIPGLYDIHTHGGGGICFDKITEDDFDKIYNYYISNGATSVLATSSTIDNLSLKKQLSILAKLCDRYPIFKGIHMEGPFLSYEYKGGMNPKYLQKPSIDIFREYQNCAKGYIKLITIAPELDGALDFIKQVSKMGVVVSLGHSGATYHQANNALECGAKSFTHTFNAMKPINHKESCSLLVSALESNAYTEIIADGKHVNKDIFKLLVKCKGKNKIIGITDSLKEAGLPNGYYLQDDGRIIQKCDKDLFYTDSNTRAGSTIGIFDCLINFANFTNENIENCLSVYSKNPANLLNINNGSISVNADADFIIMKDNQIIKVFSKGTCIYSKM